MENKRGIYLVANLNSEVFCENLIYSIRESGCDLPIRLIPFGGAPIRSKFILKEVEVYGLSRFPLAAHDFIKELRTVLVDCPMGFLYRFLTWFGDWEEFIYSDNDVVALMNWEDLLRYLDDYDFVHADEEYITHGEFNYDKPDELEKIFGTGSLLTAFTAGHFVARCNKNFTVDMVQAIKWFKENPAIPRKHDQSLMHIASLLGNWKILNLCRVPHNWLSSWAGDYNNTLSIIQTIQTKGRHRSISHIHYSGDKPSGTQPIDDLLFAKSDSKSRLRAIVLGGIKEISGYSFFLAKRKSLMRLLRKK